MSRRIAMATPMAPREIPAMAAAERRLDVGSVRVVS